MSDHILELELRLVILRYGRPKVLATLAGLEEQNVEELEREIAEAVEKRNAKKTKATKLKVSIMDLLSAESRENPEIANSLREIVVRFQNRTFLPHLRDVQRFLDRIGATQGKLKSREMAGPVLVRALAKMSRNDLVRLAEESNSSGESDYSLLARAIMGGPPMKPGDARKPGDNRTNR